MKRKITALALAVVLTLSAGGALALNEDILRKIKRADDVKELTDIAQDLADSTVESYRGNDPVPTLEEVGVYLQLIKIRADYMNEVKYEKWQKEILTALGKK